MEIINKTFNEHLNPFKFYFHQKVFSIDSPISKHLMTYGKNLCSARNIHHGQTDTIRSFQNIFSAQSRGRLEAETTQQIQSPDISLKFNYFRLFQRLEKCNCS